MINTGNNLVTEWWSTVTVTLIFCKKTWELGYIHSTNLIVACLDGSHS